VFCPLCLVSTQILRTEGIPGFWKGNALNLLRTAPFKATNFASFELLHSALVGLSGRPDGHAERFAAGALAGRTYTGWCACGECMCVGGGGEVTAAGFVLQFDSDVTLTWAHSGVARRGDAVTSTSAPALADTPAPKQHTGITATLVCFPLDVVRTRLMTRGRGVSYGGGPLRTLVGIVRNEGPGALYTGVRV
jgi:hypothetical protein